MRTLLAMGLLLGLAACNRADREAGAATGAAPGSTSTLAYEHTVAVTTDDGTVQPLQQRLLAACAAGAAETRCQVLETDVTGGHHAQIRLRATKAAVQGFVALLAAGGTVTTHKTRAEDQAEALADVARRIELLQRYQARLEALQTRADTDTDALIKLGKELTQTQGELEALVGEQTGVRRRVETELLDVTLAAKGVSAFWVPIAEALGEFRENLAKGIAFVVYAVSYLLPTALTVLVLTAVWRALRRRRERRITAPR